MIWHLFNLLGRLVGRQIWHECSVGEIKKKA